MRHAHLQRLTTLIVASIWFFGFCVAASRAASSSEELFHLGVQAHDRGDLNQAASYYEQVLALRPDAFEAGFNLGLAYTALGRYEDALRVFKSVQRVHGDSPPLLGAMASLKVRMMDFAGAEADARRLLQLDPRSKSARVTLAGIAMERSQFSEADEQLRKILESEPRDVETLFMRAVVGLRRNQLDFAKSQLETVLSIAPEHERAKRLLTELDAARHQNGLQLGNVVQWILAADKALATSLVLVFVIGVPLNFFQLRRARRIHQAFQRTPLERTIKSIYAAVLGFAVVLFYVSIPLLVVTVLLLGGGLLFAMLSAGRIPVKLFLLVLVGTIGAAYVMIRSLFFRTPTGAFGIPKTQQHEPVLYALLEDVARQVGTRAVDVVYMSPTSEIGVREEGGFWRALAGRARRVLTLGMASLPALTVQELRSVLAHEYGHYSNRDTAVGSVVYRVTRTVRTMLAGMGEQGMITWVNPAFWYLAVFHWVFALISQGLSRTQELFADRVAAVLYGPNAFMSGLEKVAVEGSLFDVTAQSWVARELKNERQFTNVFDVYFASRAQFDAGAVEEHRRTVLSREPGRYDSHPLIPVRAAAVDGIPDPGSGDSRSVGVLFRDFKALQEELTTFFTGYVYTVSGGAVTTSSE